MATKTWTNLQASTTARAADVLGNDAWAEGNIVPHSEGVLANAQFDLGTGSAYWRTGFICTISTSYVMANSTAGLSLFSQNTATGLKISNRGYVGIGKEPSETLDILGSVNITSALRLVVSATGQSVLQLKYGTGASDGFFIESYDGTKAVLGLGRIAVGSGAPDITLDINGKMGFGHANPSQTVDIAGTATADTFYASSTIKCAGTAVINNLILCATSYCQGTWVAQTDLHCSGNAFFQNVYFSGQTFFIGQANFQGVSHFSGTAYFQNAQFSQPIDSLKPSCRLRTQAAGIGLSGTSAYYIYDQEVSDNYNMFTSSANNLVTVRKNGNYVVDFSMMATSSADSLFVINIVHTNFDSSVVKTFKSHHSTQIFTGGARELGVQALIINASSTDKILVQVQTPNAGLTISPSANLTGVAQYYNLHVSYLS